MQRLPSRCNHALYDHGAVLDVMRRLLQPKNIMLSLKQQDLNQGRYISILNIIQVGLWPLFLTCVAGRLAKTCHSSSLQPNAPIIMPLNMGMGCVGCTGALM